MVDRRSDIWSFGVVLYETLTGERLCAGETVSHTLADVLRADIPFDRLPVSTPALIRELVQRCLDRNIKMRLQSIGEARIAIQEYLNHPSAGASQTAAGATTRVLQWLWPSISLALATALLTGALLYLRRPAEVSGPLRLSFTAPTGASFNDVGQHDIVISPDGRSVAFTARDREGHHLLWVRSLDSSDAMPLPGTDNAFMPVAFKRDNAIWVTDVTRDVPVRLMNGQIPIWSPDGARVILLGDGIRVIAANGVGEAIKLADGVSGPSDWSPDGRFLLFWRRGKNTRSDIWTLPLFGDQKAFPLLDSQAEEELARF